ncbi:Golgi to ER traffic protein 4 homolog [Strongyloides ratti]|uniref:Golgi to ER traffic protein 4 homolog n=1 Tax=Strongyloides ratti TaxID=34506 RepID=A0A090L2W1_STRRB|nr:Golgi to ER traffic protein 4 homolog [Strongyloides ratti]CEF61799.1 Golgi to ER traffic protein 4 homolog [Strongyloides ratti]
MARVEKLLRRLDDSFNDGNYYEAHQICRTVNNRLRISKEFEKLSQILWSGLIKLFEKAEISSGEDLAYLYIDSLRDGKILCDTNILTNFTYLLQNIPKTVSTNSSSNDEKSIDNRNKLIGNFINYTKVVAQTEPEKIRGMESAFVVLGKQLAKEGNYVAAENQFMMGNDGEGTSEMILKITEGDTTLDCEKYLLRAIFQLLCMKKVHVASIVLKNYMSKHILFNQQKPAYVSQVGNFLWLFIACLEGGYLTQTSTLIKRTECIYLLIEGGDKYIDRIMEVFFNIKKEKNDKKNNLLENLMQSIGGGKETSNNEDGNTNAFSDSPVGDKDILGITSNVHSIESMTDKLFEYFEDCHEEIPVKIEETKDCKNDEPTKNIKELLIDNDELD